MKKFLTAAAALFSVPLSTAPALAHMVWIERPAPDVAHIYFGEPDHREKTGDVLDRLVPTVFTTGTAPLPISREADTIAARVKPDDRDIRLLDERYPPFGEGDRGTMRPMMYARHGRAATHAAMAFEFVPMVPNGNRFTLLLSGKPLARRKVTIITPDGAETKTETDETGAISLTPSAAGQYLLQAADIDRKPGETGGARYDFTARVTTLTFIQQ